jgi:hypothetical protein
LCEPDGQTQGIELFRMIAEEPAMSRITTLILLAVLLAAGGPPLTAAQEIPRPSEEYRAFQNPERVAVRGYDGEIVDPFISRDGRYLFFNTTHFDPSKTALHYADRTDDLTFVYRGKIGGVNIDGVLTAVCSLDRDGNFYFISPRSHEGMLATIHRGKFKDGVVTDIRPIMGLNRPGQISFDMEISADGNTLYFVDAIMSGSKVPGAGPRSAHLAIAIRDGDTFQRLEKSAEMLATINTAENLEYGACTSADGSELFFDRFTIGEKSFGIWRAVRPSVDVPFGTAQRVSVLNGFVEAQTLSPDGRSLYYQKREGDRFQFYRVTRAAVGTQGPSQSTPSSEKPVAKAAGLRERLTAKVERIKAGARKQLARGRDPSAIFKAMQEKVKPLIDAGRPLEAEAELDRILEQLGGEKP